MKAIVFHGVKDIRFEADWPQPRNPGPGEVLVATSWCGICGTDMEDYQRGAVIPVAQPHPVSGRMAPIVIGHEYSGRIAELGPGVEGLDIGQRVAVECVRVCKTCYWCRRGEYASCLNFVSVGQWDDGGMADCFVIPAENCIPIPDHLGEDVAALAEPLAVMVRAIRKGRLQPGETVTVVGAGAIGLCGVAAARAGGAGQVITIAHGGHRAQVAAQVGATHVLNSRAEHWKEEFLELTGGLGSDLVIDAGATPAAIRLALELTKKRGRCVLNSVIDADIPLPALDLLINEKELIGTCAHAFDQEFAWGVQYMADGRVDLRAAITDRIYLEDAVTKGFDRLLTDRNQIKILVTPHREWVAQDSHSA